MGNLFRFKQIVSTYDSTPEARIAPNAILEYFQEAAQRNIEELNIGIDFLKENHYAWILVKYEVNFLKYPKTEEEVQIETEAVGINRFEAYRRFKLLSASGEELVTAKSTWMIINTETGRLVRISNIKELENLAGGDTEVYRLPSLKAIEDSDHEVKFRVRYLDIDINYHVNNVRYFEWAIESLPWEFIRKYDIKTLRMVFKEQAFYGETVTTSSKRIGPDTWRIDVKNDKGKLLCQIELIGREREEEFKQHP